MTLRELPVGRVVFVPGSGVELRPSRGVTREQLEAAVRQALARRPAPKGGNP